MATLRGKRRAPDTAAQADAYGHSYVYVLARLRRYVELAGLVADHNGSKEERPVELKLVQDGQILGSAAIQWGTRASTLLGGVHTTIRAVQFRVSTVWDLSSE